MKSARYIATKLIEKEEERECSTRDYRIPLWKRMWHLNIPAKTKIFTWKACMNGLLTFINLQKKGITVDEVCLHCGREPETISHSLVSCDLARKVWSCWMDCPVDSLENWSNFSNLTLEVLAKGTSMDLKIFCMIAWSIWYCRHLILHPFFNQERWLE